MTTRPLATFLNQDGQPTTVKILLRPSESAPARVKALFAVEVEDAPSFRQPDGRIEKAKLPEGATISLGNEFRLEMN